VSDVLNLGCGNRLIAGAINHDRVWHRPEVDVVWDLNELPWPWADDSLDLVVAYAFLEHLHITLIESVNECWRILRPGGELYMKLPYWNADDTYRDPTHRWRFSLGVCDIFDPTTKYGARYGFYGIKPWQIVKPAQLNPSKTSFTVRMRVVK